MSLLRLCEAFALVRVAGALTRHGACKHAITQGARTTMTSNRLLSTFARGVFLTFAIAVELAAATALPRPAQRPTGTLRYRTPAGTLPAAHRVIDGYHTVVLPDGPLVTAVGAETTVKAPKTFGLTLSQDGNSLAMINNGTGPNSADLE
jgi:hypothetical protein